MLSYNRRDIFCISRMEIDEALKQRLAEKGMTQYQLAKKIAKLDGTGRPPSSYTGRFAKVFGDDPKGRTYRNIEEIVRALGGRLLIEWTDTKTQELK